MKSKVSLYFCLSTPLWKSLCEGCAVFVRKPSDQNIALLSLRNQMADIFNCSSLKIIFFKLHLWNSVHVSFYNWFWCQIPFKIRICSLAVIKSEMTASNVYTLESLIIVQHILLIFQKIPTCTLLLRTCTFINFLE